MFNAHLHIWLCNTSLSYSLTWYHLPSLHQKLPMNLCCDGYLDLIPVLPKFAVTLRLLPWSASRWHHSKGFTSQLKAQRVHRNTLHQYDCPSYWMMALWPKQACWLFKDAGVPRKQKSSKQVSHWSHYCMQSVSGLTGDRALSHHNNH